MTKSKFSSGVFSMGNRVGAVAGAGDARRPVADFSAIHTPPSNTGVNDGVSHGGKRKASPKASKILGDIPRKKSSGRFVEATPATDLELRSEVLEGIKAFDLTAQYLDHVLGMVVKGKLRDQTVAVAQSLSILAFIRDVLVSDLIACGVSVPVAPLSLISSPPGSHK